MAVHTITNIQKIPITLQQAWDFYCDHANLQALTPPQMNFRVISEHQAKRLYPGQIIEYRVSPVLGISLYWMTEITQITAPTYFVDEQRKGPYSFWQHQHHFKAIEGGVEMTDIVHYRNPLWLLGELANALFIKRKLRSIFEYRFYKVEELFGKWPGGQEMRIEIR
jgi:ligand-binding SRPBCC domain-containing protein